MSTSNNLLIDKFPEVFNLLDPEKNKQNNIDIEKITFDSKIKAYFFCTRDPTQINYYVECIGTKNKIDIKCKCNFCVPFDSNLVQEKYPEKFRYLDLLKNKEREIDINILTCSSGKIVDIFCDKDSQNIYEYQKKLFNYLKQKHCPCNYCKTEKIVDNNGESVLLKNTYPEIFKMLDKNENIKDNINIDMLSQSSHKKVHWICNKSDPPYKWCKSVNDIIKQKSCPCKVCKLQYNKAKREDNTSTLLKDRFPDIFNQLHPTKNDHLNFKTLTYGSNKYATFICDTVYDCGCAHEWKSIICNRTNSNSGCPYCSNLLICEHQSFMNDPLLFSQYKQENNPKIENPWLISKNSHVKITWQCFYHLSCKHIWSSTVHSRTSGNTGCPFCKHTNGQVCPCDSLNNNKLLKSEFFEELNPGIKLENLSKSSNKKIMWKCSIITCSYQWVATINSRISSNSGCPKCSGKIKKNLQDYIDLAELNGGKYLGIKDDNNNFIQDIPSNTHINDGFWQSNCLIKEKIHLHEWSTSYTNINSGRWCNICHNKTEAKICNFLKNEFPYLMVRTKYKVNWCKNNNNNFLPFDLIMTNKNINIIIECDGGHHFKNVKYWKSDPEIVRKTDIYKEKQAIKHNHYIIRINQKNVWDDSIEWEILLKNNIEKILENQCNVNEIIYIAKDTSIYDKHKEEFDNYDENVQIDIDINEEIDIELESNQPNEEKYNQVEELID